MRAFFAIPEIAPFMSSILCLVKTSLLRVPRPEGWAGPALMGRSF